MNKDVIIVEILETVISSMIVSGVNKVNYSPGRSSQIIQSINTLDNSITLKEKYPLFAVLMPIREVRGSGFYANIKIDRIIIAALSTEPFSEVMDRYKEGREFKSVLYPCYYEFFKQLAYSPYIIGQDPDAFVHTKVDNTAVARVGEGLTDYIESIEIFNLELTLTQTKTC